jgi:glycosyltransferase involved in cell wall biosynthesis
MKIAILVPDNRDELRRYSDPEPCFGTAPTALLEGLAKEGTCEIHIVCCTQRALRSPGKLADNVHYHSIVVPKWGWLRGVYIGCVRAVRSLLRKINPDVVHGQGTERYCALAAVYSAFPNVLTIHGNIRQIAKVNRARPFSFLWLTSKLERFALLRTNGVVCISSHTQRNVRDLALRTWVVPNAVASEFFKIPHIPVLPKTIVCVANISPLKNQVRLIEALDPVSQMDEFRVVFYGSISNHDPYGVDFLRKVSDRSWCEYAGFADQQKLRSALSSASLLVLPSLEENCPMAILEAMAAGIPVTATNAGGVPDLVTDRVEGLLFNPNDVQSMRASIQQLLHDENLALRLAACAKDKATKQNHPESVAKRHVEIYNEIQSRVRSNDPLLRTLRSIT